LAAFREAGHNAVGVTEPGDLACFTHLVLPGVGSFGAFGRVLKDTGFWAALIGFSSRPDASLLGVCVGAQILMRASEESPSAEGLGLLSGYVRRVRDEESDRVPRIGWDYLHATRKGGFRALTNQNQGPGQALGPRFYFAHSYCMQPDDDSAVVAVSDSSRSIPAIVQKSNVVAVQFHPERSGIFGRVFLDQFATGSFHAP
jgi:imidazole glycerol phosphate synthase glutamine amidotransferase subunit